MSTIEERFHAAVELARAQGVHVRLNVMTCCRSCTTSTDLGLPSDEAMKTTPNAFQYGGQGQELIWRNGEPFYREEPYETAVDDDGDEEYYDFAPRRNREERAAHDVFFSHGGPDLTAASALTEAFRAQGFAVDWDGTMFNSVHVQL